MPAMWLKWSPIQNSSDPVRTRGDRSRRRDRNDATPSTMTDRPDDVRALRCACPPHPRAVGRARFLPRTRRIALSARLRLRLRPWSPSPWSPPRRPRGASSMATTRRGERRKKSRITCCGARNERFERNSLSSEPAETPRRALRSPEGTITSARHCRPRRVTARSPANVHRSEHRVSRERARDLRSPVPVVKGASRSESTEKRRWNWQGTPCGPRLSREITASLAPGSAGAPFRVPERHSRRRVGARPFPPPPRAAALIHSLRAGTTGLAAP